MDDPTFAFTSRFLLAASDAAGVPRKVLFKRVRNVVLRLTRRIDPTVTLEVGAYEADFSRWARREFPGARAMAFEANPYVHEVYAGDAIAQGVDYRNVAISGEAGPVTIHVPRDFNGTERARTNQMASLTTNLLTEEHEEVTVDGVRLDDVVELGPDDRLVAWIDVEGALEQVLSGARQTLARASLVFVEVENQAIWESQWLDTDVAAWFAELGLVPILRDFQRSQQYNLVLVSAELARDPHVANLAARAYAPVVPTASASATSAASDRVGPPVPESRVGRLQGLLSRGLRAQSAEVRGQNQKLRKQNKRLRRQVRDLRAALAERDAGLDQDTIS